VNLILDELTAVSPETASNCSLENYLALPDHTMDARDCRGARSAGRDYHRARPPLPARRGDPLRRLPPATATSSQIAAETDARYIVFCGVHFMAESADVLGRDGQQVILPDLNAGCSMADMGGNISS